MSEEKENYLIGIDFSINKPACCIYDQNKKTYKFIGWPHTLQKRLYPLYERANVDIIERGDKKIKNEDISTLMRFEIVNATYLAKLIVKTLEPYLSNTTRLALEGISYASSGNINIQLGGYKYMLMSELSKYMELDNIYTYSPGTVKATANCSKRGLGKDAMIKAFISNSNDNSLKSYLRNDTTSEFKKKNSDNWIDHLDDLVDSYWVLDTLRIKENI